MSEFRSKMDKIYQKERQPQHKDEIELTEAVCILHKCKSILRGFHVIKQKNGPAKIEIIETAPRIFDTLTRLLETLQPRATGEVDIRIEDNHMAKRTNKVILYCGLKERLIIDSALLDYEDMLTHDGRMAILFSNGYTSLLLTEHKEIHIQVPTHDIAPFKRVLRSLNITERDYLHTAATEEHVHCTTSPRKEKFEEMCQYFGADTVEDGDWWQSA